MTRWQVSSLMRVPCLALLKDSVREESGNFLSRKAAAQL